MSTPSKIKGIFPWGSLFRNSESETVAQNIAKILARTGDTFRPLPKEEYTSECEKDGNKGKVLYGDYKCPYNYDHIAKYLETGETAALVSEDWAKALKE